VVTTMAAKKSVVHSSYCPCLVPTYAAVHRLPAMHTCLVHYT